MFRWKTVWKIYFLPAFLIFAGFKPGLTFIAVVRTTLVATQLLQVKYRTSQVKSSQVNFKSECLFLICLELILLCTLNFESDKVALMPGQSMT